ncbi:DUF1758 domain-containing protein [Trichonephila inaurata madagascariensis]|uniref:DUF1758 domain-containing protein n=1 Tax=Trichonephila inaurata madagascariensis TaxID=2747483 RepID=A0A8X6Y1Q9_9ARAC|nr:DUF1758 domain-containing protein [Trichonephila inaurata madagascariensis]
MRPERTALKIFNATTFNKRPKGRLKRRWKYYVDKDFSILKVKNWRTIAGRSCLERLGLPRKRAQVRISCLGASDTRTNGISEIKFTPHFTSNISFVTSVYVVNKIVGQLPHFSLDSSWSEPFSDLKLADPTFFKSGPIDILIGVNIALPMLKGQSLSLGDSKPFAVRSDLGWIVAGNVPSEEMFSSIAVNSIQVVTEDLVSNF